MKKVSTVAAKVGRNFTAETYRRIGCGRSQQLVLRARNTTEVDRFSSSLPQFNFSDRPSRHFLGGAQNPLRFQKLSGRDYISGLSCFPLKGSSWLVMLILRKVFRLDSRKFAISSDEHD